MSEKESQQNDEVLVAYKGFDVNLKCRDFQFAIGETFVHEGEVKACRGGFHACEYPLNVFNYYAPAGNRFAVVEQRGPFSREAGGDTKVASKSLTVKMEIGLPGLIKAAIEYTTKRCLPVDQKSPEFSDADQGAASSTGDQGAASSTGYQGAASSTGYQGAASSTGARGAASSTGSNSVAMACGYAGRAMAGESGAIVLCYRDDNYNLVHIRASKVGDNGIKAGVWYMLDLDGQFVEFKE